MKKRCPDGRFLRQNAVAGEDGEPMNANMVGHRISLLMASATAAASRCGGDIVDADDVGAG